VKLIRAGLGDIVDLGCSIPSLIDGIGKSIDGHFGDRIQPQDEVGGKAAVEIGERVVGFQPINDVAVGEGRQAVKFHIAIPVGAADEVVAATRRVDEGSRRKLQRVG
jgi:dihydropteroate synthase